MTTMIPRGNQVIATMAMPKDTNGSGDIFGGWLVSQMDMGAAICAMQIAKGRVATVAINRLIFQKPVNVGDIVTCYAELEKIGRTSMTIHVEVWTLTQDSFSHQKVTEASFVFVALDEQRQPRPVKQD